MTRIRDLDFEVVIDLIERATDKGGGGVRRSSAQRRAQTVEASPTAEEELRAVVGVPSGYRVRMAELLAERNASVESLLRVVDLVRPAQMYLGLAALSNRVHLLLPCDAAILREVAPGCALPERLGSNSVLRVECDGPALAVGVVTIDANRALDELEDAERATCWKAVVDALLSFANGVVMNRTQFLTETRAAIAVKYQPRSGDAECAFLRGVHDHFARIGLSAEQAAIWNRLYSASGSGRLLSISTELGPKAPTSRTGVLNDNISFDQAIDLINLVNPIDATAAALRLGAVSGALEINSILGSEILLANDRDPDVMVWLPPKT